ncbi:MAG: peptidylprolyl isomerase [Patescibacteria group bacterium]|nr:peptidylprolyl isomerase [Patescibacteria group bacterium]
MKKAFKIFSWAILAAVLAAGLLLAGGVLWLKTGHITFAKAALLKKLPAPVALVGSRPVWSTEYFSRLDSLKPYQPAGMDAQTYEQTVFNRLVQEKAMGQLLAEKKVESPASAFGDKAAQALGAWQDKKTALQIWYNGQQDLNSVAFQKAADLQQAMQNGKTFEDLAAQNSQEPLSRAYSGDLGFLEAKDLLPEILKATDDMKVGQTKQVATRQGLHIIKLEGKDNLGQDNGQRLHLKQIFLPESGFENWLDTEINKIKIIKFLSI